MSAMVESKGEHLASPIQVAISSDGGSKMARSRNQYTVFPFRAMVKSKGDDFTSLNQIRMYLDS